MARGRKEVVRKLIGYDLFRLTEAEINNRLDVAFFPDRVHALEYHDFELFSHEILPQLKRHNLLEEFTMNMNILIKKTLKTKEELQNFTTLDFNHKIEMLDGKNRAICALKAYYENKL
jgi:hypothetical protein